MACNQQQYNCISRTNQENLKQKCFLLRKNCSSSTPEVCNPWWNSAEPYLLLAFSDEDTHPRRWCATAEGMNCAWTITLVSLQNCRGGCVVILPLRKAEYRRKSEVSITTNKLWFHCEVNDGEISEIYNAWGFDLFWFS